MTASDDRPPSASGHTPINALLRQMHNEHQAAGEPCPDWCPIVPDDAEAD